MRSLAPRNTIAFLEINDLAATLGALTDNKIFAENSAPAPDFSSLENLQAAVVIAGFETSEEQIADDNSVFHSKPKFIAIADTHTWKPAAVSIVENQIGKFVEEIYGSNPRLEKSEKGDAKLFAWTNGDRRKLFAAVSQSVIYFGNDETLLDECLAVRRGEAENLLNDQNLSQARALSEMESGLAFGYVSTNGVKQFADSLADAFASSENHSEDNFAARVLPPILQNTTREIVWTAKKLGNKIEDNFFVRLEPESASVFNTAFARNRQNSIALFDFVPPNVNSLTSYNFQNPALAWHGFLMVTTGNTDAATGKFLIQISDQLLAPYGISNSEMFLNAVDSHILTAQFDADGVNSATIATVRDIEAIKKTIAGVNFNSPPETFEQAEIWKSVDGETIAAFVENKLILGTGDAVLRCLRAKKSSDNFSKNQNLQRFLQTDSTSVTFARDNDSAKKIISLFGNIEAKNQTVPVDYTIETRFTADGIERKSVSDFGFLGTILEQFKD